MTTSTKRPRRLLDACWFPGFRPQVTVKGVFGDPKVCGKVKTERLDFMVDSFLY